MAPLAWLLKRCAAARRSGRSGDVFNVCSPRGNLTRHHDPKTGQDWQLGRLEMARLADAGRNGPSRHTTLLRKILAPRVLTGIGAASPYPELLGVRRLAASRHEHEHLHLAGLAGVTRYYDNMASAQPLLRPLLVLTDKGLCFFS